MLSTCFSLWRSEAAIAATWGMRMYCGFENLDYI
ncbi:hypothetical protein SLEP1_g49813 [Rubroshorea leprosula]|uniref:Uncharacterized protein n=1 Tax=Rubroshorea leprosula TaxID=152421 RepID=A0AAV5LYT0_9ROSI|nr:hypothetical protein SLEP1_g49813 [Rubroshorea leprosula]